MVAVNNDAEVNMLFSFALLKQWLQGRVGAQDQTWELAECRRRMKQNPVFCTPTFVLGWGDSFLLDQMYFHTGGNLKLSDYPDVPDDVKVGDVVQLRSMPHVVTSVGLLTFNARRV